MYKKIWFYLVLAVHLITIFWFWYAGSGRLFVSDGASLMLALGRLSGLLLVSLVLTQLLIMSRAPWLEQAFGLDKLARLHHKIGRYFIVFLVLHPGLIILSYSKFAEVGLIAQYITFLKDDDLLQASIAFFLFLGIIVYSLLQVWKRWDFERWYYVHLALYLAIALAWDHQLPLGGDFSASTLFTYYWYVAYAFVGMNLLYFRFLLPVLNYRKHRFVVADIKTETADVHSVYISGKQLGEFHFRGGQFLIVRFLKKPFYWEAHPFSISKNFDGVSLRQSIKAIGDFTKTVPNIPTGTKVLIEGPYGVFTAQKSHTNKVLLIAGGIGITPYRAIIEDLGKAGKDVHLVYGNKTEADIALRGELEVLATKYHIKIHHVISGPPPRGEGQGEVSVKNDYITKVSATPANSPSRGGGQELSALTTFSTGFVTPELIAQLVPDAREREVFLCGPPPMMNALLKSLPSIGVDAQKIYFEKFSL